MRIYYVDKKNMYYLFINVIRKREWRFFGSDL